MEDSIHQVIFCHATPIVIGRILLLILLLIFSALISGSETAFFSLSPNDVSKLQKEGSKGSHGVLKLLGMQDYLLATILISNNFVNICCVILANSIIDSLVIFQHMEFFEFSVKVIFVTFMLLFFGEIMPKIFATQKAYNFAVLMSVPLLFVKTLVKPFAYILIKSSNHINETVAVKKVNISIDELSNAIEITTDQSVEEKKMLSGIVSFVTTEADEIMCPRVDIVSLDYKASFAEVCETVVKYGNSRIPVYKESIDNISGVLFARDLIPYINNADDFAWQELCRKPYFIPEHKKINDLFVEFQNNKIHMAIVVDEYGSTKGLITLEDVLEEIVGEISDESDNKKPSYVKIDPHTYIFEGKTHLIDFLKVIGFDDDFFDEIKGEAESVAGLMLEVNRDFLKQGETMNFGDISLSVESLEGRRIDKVRVHIKGRS